jgi:hypothetical protein
MREKLLLQDRSMTFRISTSSKNQRWNLWKLYILFFPLDKRRMKLIVTKSWLFYPVINIRKMPQPNALKIESFRKCNGHFQFLLSKSVKHYSKNATITEISIKYSRSFIFQWSKQSWSMRKMPEKVENIVKLSL